LPEVSGRKSVEDFLGEKIEFLALGDEKLVDLRMSLYKKQEEPSFSPIGSSEYATDMNRFLFAVHLSFAEHRPLTLSPDMFWLLIVQGFAIHINQNPEKYRDLLVKHKNKETIRIRRDEFIKGDPDNAWDEVLPEFTEKMEKYTRGDINNLIVQKFSTTSVNDTLAYRIVLMDALSNYFNYDVATLCGIPEIKLEGTPEDWKKIIDKADELAKYDMNWWIVEIIPYLKKIHESSQGNVDRDFWQSIYKVRSESGGDTVSGWVIKFFPYLLRPGGQGVKYCRNPHISKNLNKIGHNAPKFNLFPSGLAKASFNWIIGPTPELTVTYPMEFFAGFLGVKQDSKTKALKPVISWGIKEAENNKFSLLPDKLKPYFLAGNKTKGFSVWDVEINDDDLKQIGELGSNLMSIEIHLAGKISDKGLAHISGFKNLMVLDIPNSKISDESVDTINKLQELAFLDVSGAHLTDAWLDKLKLPKLQSLNIDNTKITQAAFEKFKQKHPKLELPLEPENDDDSESDFTPEYMDDDYTELYNFDFKASPELMKLIAELRKNDYKDKKPSLYGIAWTEDSRKLEVLLAAVNGPRGAEKAIELIQFLYPAKNILPWLKSKNPLYRKAACVVLGSYRDFRNIDALLKMLNDDDDSVRIAALRALSSFDIFYDTEKLDYLLYQKTSRTFFYILLDVIAPGKNKDFIAGKLQEYYQTAKEAEKMEILYLIGELKLKKLEPLVLNGLSNSDSEFVSRAIDAAWKIKSEKAVPILIKILGDDGALYNINNVFRAFSEIKDKRAIEPVIRYIENNEHYSSSGLEALCSLTGDEEFLKILLTNKNKKFKERAIEFILDCRDAEFAPLLVKMLSIKDKNYSKAAAQAINENHESLELDLAKLEQKYPVLKNVEAENQEIENKKKTFENLIKELDENPSKWERARAAEALGEYGDERAVPYLRKAVKEDYSPVCEDADLAIVKILYRDKPDVLLTKFKDPKSCRGLKEYCLKRFAELKYKPAFAVLEKNVRDDSRRKDEDDFDDFDERTDGKEDLLEILLKIDREKAIPLVDKYLGKRLACNECIKEFLIKEYNDKYFKILIKRFDTPEPFQIDYIDIFVAKKDQRALPLLGKLLRSEYSFSALSAIIDIGGAEAEKYVIEALNYNNRWEETLDYLAEHGTQKSLKPLKNLLNYVLDEDKLEINEVIQKIQSRQSGASGKL
jgi:HEAT repeat protein